MRVLVDTHVFFWWVTDDPKLSVGARNTIAEDANEIVVSAVIAWELAVKARFGKWPQARDLAIDIDSVLEANGFTPLAITLEHARVAGFLPGNHRDPFDRMLAAQAQIEGIPLVTADPAFRTLSVQIVW